MPIRRKRIEGFRPRGHLFHFAEKSAMILVRPADAERRVSPLRATYFLCEQKVGKESFRGENTDSTSGTEGRALAHSIFPLKTPRRERFCGNAETADAARLPGKPVFPETLSALRGGRRNFCVYFRRGVSRYAKPLIIADAPLAVVIDFWANHRRLRCWFACGCDSSTERISCRSAPDQR